MDKKLVFIVREVYGRTLFAPGNINAEVWTDLLKVKNLTQQQINVLSDLGCVIEFQYSELVQGLLDSSERKAQ